MDRDILLAGPAQAKRSNHVAPERGSCHANRGPDWDGIALETLLRLSFHFRQGQGPGWVGSMAVGKMTRCEREHASHVG
jgi:hypothetical protein